MQVTTQPFEYGINASYDYRGRNPRITINLRGKWSASGLGVAGVGAHGTYEMSLSKEDGSRFNKPHRLILNGIINDEIPEKQREALAKEIKDLLKAEIKEMIEKMHGHLSLAINKVW